MCRAKAACEKVQVMRCHDDVQQSARFIPYILGLFQPIRFHRSLHALMPETSLTIVSDQSE